LTPSDDRPTIRVHLFGPPLIERDGIPISVARRPLCNVLFAMILLAGPDRRLSRRAVAADLWPADDEPTAVTNLRRHLSYLMAALPAAEQCIGRDRETVWGLHSAAIWCDVVEFESGALELYRGEFMEGSGHEWVLAQRERLRAAAVDGFLSRAEDERERDDYEGAIASARRATEIDPGNESAAQLEIELHGERGDIAAIDAAYAAHARCLRDLDANPAPQTVALVERFHLLAREAAARIPRPLTSFIETHSLPDVSALVAAHRLVTIAGPGGVGKTRLALEVAHRIAGGFPDGAYFADLSAVSEGDALADTLSRALGAPTDLASKGFAGIHTFMRNRRALLLLDNCEQITESCAWFVNGLLEATPYVHIVVTTREAFGLHAERCYALEPLSQVQAEQLFVERARGAAWNAGDLSTAKARIASVCERLDRLPLALELAASMLGALPLADVERQLDEGLDRLRSRDHTTPPRHRSLPGVIAWSVSLLNDREHDAFTRLAIFAGPFSADAAEAVCAVDVATLAKLVSKSVLVRPDAVESRFVFLNSIADYARRLLDVAPGVAAIRNAHAAWFAAIAMRSRQSDFWPFERAWLEELDRDFPNFIQALNWSLFAGGNVDNGISLAIGLAHYFWRRGFYSDGGSWLRAAIDRTEAESVQRGNLTERLSLFESRLGHFESAYALARDARIALSRSGVDLDLANALNQEAVTLLYLGRDVEAREQLELALPLARRSRDARSEGTVLYNLAYTSSRSDSGASRVLYAQALRRYTDAGDQTNIAWTLNALAASDYVAGRYDATNDNLERALAIHRAVGDPNYIAGIVSDLGDVAVMRGQMTLALRYYLEALAFIEARKDLRANPHVLSGIAALAVHEGRTRDAARLLGAAHWEDFGTVTPARIRIRDHVRALVENGLGADECALELAIGHELPRNEALQLARSVVERAPTTP
jgi:predicted ATPase/DNA-binding SARP family transcriptional activator